MDCCQGQTAAHLGVNGGKASRWPTNQSGSKDCAGEQQGESDVQGALEDLDGAIDGGHDTPLVRNLRAWIHATCGNERFRNGGQAVRDATQANEQSEWQDHGFLETWAAAYAEQGDFRQAARWQQEALDLASEESRADYQQRLELYRQERPYRDPTLR